MDILLDPGSAAAVAEILSSDDEPAQEIQGKSLSRKMMSNSEKFGLDFLEKPLGSDEEREPSPVQEPNRANSFAERVQQVSKPKEPSQAQPAAVISLDSSDDSDEDVPPPKPRVASSAAKGLSFNSGRFMPAGSRTASTTDTNAAPDVDMNDPEMAAAASTYVRPKSDFERKTWFSAKQGERERNMASAAASSSAFGQSAGSSFGRSAGGMAHSSALPPRRGPSPRAAFVRPGVEEKFEKYFG